jgi:hypothetical protein
VLEELEPFADQRVISKHPDPRNIGAGPRDAVDKTQGDRVFGYDHHDKRNCSRGIARGQDTSD